MVPFFFLNLFSKVTVSSSIQQLRFTLGTDCQLCVHGNSYNEELITEDLSAMYAPFFSGADFPHFNVSLARFCLASRASLCELFYHQCLYHGRKFHQIHVNLYTHTPEL